MRVLGQGANSGGKHHSSNYEKEIDLGSALGSERKGRPVDHQGGYRESSGTQWRDEGGQRKTGTLGEAFVLQWTADGCGGDGEQTSVAFNMGGVRVRWEGAAEEDVRL